MATRSLPWNSVSPSLDAEEFLKDQILSALSLPFGSTGPGNRKQTVMRDDNIILFLFLKKEKKRISQNTNLSKYR